MSSCSQLILKLLNSFILERAPIRGPFFLLSFNLLPTQHLTYNSLMMGRLPLILTSLLCFSANAATIAIIDTGFDLDHDFLQPRIMKQETDEEGHHPDLIKEFHGWDFQDNSHMKEAVIKDPGVLGEILRYRNLRAKGHGQGLTFEEFEWFKKKSSDKNFMDKVKKFKRQAHGTFVAGIALREGENINIFPIRGLNIPSPVLMVEDRSKQGHETLKAHTPEEKFKEEIRNSLKRVTQKFSKICKYLSLNKVNVVNASYGITYKNIMTKFRESYKDFTGLEIDEARLQVFVDQYFEDLYRAGASTIKKYPNILFVFSAGNSSLDNDKFHHYPSHIRLPNTMAVAAMNGDFLASFSNYGVNHVDIGAPGVGIPSIVPSVYSGKTHELYSPSSGTSMAAPYISNIAAQVMNTNKSLTPEEVKSILLGTGDEKVSLKGKIASASVVNNNKAIKAALLSKDMSVAEAINLAKLDLIPIEDKIQFGLPPAKAPELLKEKIMETIPKTIAPEDLDDITDSEITSEQSSSEKSPVTKQPDNSVPPVSPAPVDPPKPADPVPASPTSEQSPTPSEETPASSSQSQPELPSSQSPETLPSSPQL